MANYSRWTEVKDKPPAPSAETRTGIEQNLALGQLIYELRTEAKLSRRELAQRMGTRQSAILGSRKVWEPAIGSILSREWPLRSLVIWSCRFPRNSLPS